LRRANDLRNLIGNALPIVRGTPRHASSPEAENYRRGGRRLLEFVLILSVCLVFTFAVVRPLVVEAFYISSDSKTPESMAPTLQAGDHVLVARFIYRFADPHRGDIVVFKGYGSGNETVIKRVVGVAGDTVEIRDGVLYVNGERQKEPYVNYRLTNANFFGPQRVPEGRVFVMGDNRSNSRDSRSFGPVPEEGLLGRVLLRFWPLQRLALMR
jgi:signal peptidase I